jgi:hypothetical protein
VTNHSEWRRAFAIAWGAVSVLLLAMLLAPWVLPATSLAAALPQCEARSRGGECSLCGMTTAFLHLSGGRWAEAREANRGGAALYSLFWMNTLAAGILLSGVARRRQGPAAADRTCSTTSRESEDD